MAVMRAKKLAKFANEWALEKWDARHWDSPTEDTVRSD